MKLRVSEGVPSGRVADLYHPGKFQQREEVIVFTKEEFQRTYNSIQEQIYHVNKLDIHTHRSQDYLLLEYWPRILERINLLELNMRNVFEEKPVQSYLDAYLYGIIKSTENKHVLSERNVSVQSRLQI